MMDYKIKILEKRDKYFYCTLGEFFSLPDVRKEMPYLKDEYDRKWLVALDNDGNVLGVGAYKLLKNGTAKMQSDYVFPNYRHQGIYSKIVEMRINMAKRDGAKRIQTVTMSRIIMDHLKEKNFKIVIQRSKYNTLELEL